MLLENNPYPNDVRVRQEAITLVRAGYRVSVVSPNNDRGFRIGAIEGVGVYQYPQFAERTGLIGYLSEYAWAMLATLVMTLVASVREGFDVLHAHNPPDMFFLIAVLFKPLGKRFVFDHHDLSPEMYQAKFGTESSGLVHSLLLIFELLTFKLSDQVISTNDSYREIALTRGKVPKESVTVVRNAPDLKRVKPVAADPELRARASTIIGYVGKMGRQDGVDYLLRAVAHLVQDLAKPDVLCVIVGTGEALPALKNLARTLAIEDHMWFTGRISDHQLMTYLSTADICVDPDPSNPFNDRSSMIKMSEYMALGKPIVAFDLPEHRVTAGDAASYAQPNDELDFARKLAALIDDPETRTQMGEIGRSRVQSELALSHQEEQLLKAYARLLSRQTT